MNIQNLVSLKELEKSHNTQSILVERFNKSFDEKWSISEIFETEVSFSFRVFLNGNTDTFWQFVKR